MDLIEMQQAADQVASTLTAPGQPLELVQENVLGADLLVFRHRNRSLGELLRASTDHGDRPYVLTDASALSFADHAAQVASLAAAFRDEHGITRGDRVVIASANSVEWVLAFWATVSLGAVAVGFNAWWSPREVQHAMDLVTPSLVVADAKRQAVFAAHDVPVLSAEDDLPRLAGRLGVDLPEVAVGEDDPAVVLFTSGTSGRAKGVVHSHRNLLAVVDYHRYNDALGAAFGDPLDPRDKRYLMVLPLFHVASLHNLVVPRLATGSTVVLHQGAFDVDRVLRLVESARVTHWGAVPTMANRLLEHPDLTPYDLSSLRGFALASAPSSPAFKERLRKALPFAEHNLADSYGLTEHSTAATVATPLDLAVVADSVGRPIVTVELQVRDALDSPVPDGVEGEVCLRSPFVMLGYYGDEKATAQAIDPERWLRTGDIGVLRDGRLQLTTRRSDLILRGGENVYPAEVEGVLAEHPGVREVVVLGTPHDDLGQEVAAVVVVDDGVQVEALQEHCREQLAYYKVPSRWRLTTEPLPRNATGKVVRSQVST